MTEAQDREILDRVHEGFRRVRLAFPYLAGLIQQVRVYLDRRVGTMGVFASGRLAVSPDFVRPLSPDDLFFVLTHELYHLTLRTHDRGQGSNRLDFNYAHDFIINDMLREELQVKAIPAGGMDWPGARLLSAEKIMGDLQRNPNLRPSRSWDAVLVEGQPGEGDGPAGDVLDAALEREWFPGESREEQEARAGELKEQAARAASLKAVMDVVRGRRRGTEAGGQSEAVTALRGLFRPPWELALQRWLESMAPSERSYERPSRRGADRKDVVMPGRKREAWTLHIVLDTSGSMVGEIPRALGAIADFCEAAGVDQVHLIQCDTEVGSDEVLDPLALSRWEVKGYGGSDLTPAMSRLAESPDVAVALILTDGDIEYPRDGVPYGVLWVLPSWKDSAEFQPPYGKVIAMTPGQGS